MASSSFWWSVTPVLDHLEGRNWYPIKLQFYFQKSLCISCNLFSKHPKASVDLKSCLSCVGCMQLTSKTTMSPLCMLLFSWSTLHKGRIKWFSSWILKTWTFNWRMFSMRPMFVLMQTHWATFFRFVEHNFMILEGICGFVGLHDLPLNNNTEIVGQAVR